MNASRSSAKDDSNSSDNMEDDDELEISFDESVLQLMDEPFEPKINASKLRTDQKYKGFDSTMGNTWIYPTNYPIRQYQHNISRVSLFKNTLVVLPTGLGKTFIASVVMYNIFRWYPKGKIIFMAPTRPLVAQQINACYQVMGFPKDETVELTGRQTKKIRAIAWHTKRVFYCTPQVVWSDMNDNEINFPINDIKLMVVDEAHKAKGKYAYTEVIQSIWSRNKLFRVLALSATPGRSMNDVSEVVQNLLISNIEVRRESSIDVAPYVFKKNIKTIPVPLGERLTEIRQRLFNLVEPYVQKLSNQQVIGGHIGNLTKAWLLFDRNKFRESTLANRHPDQSSINGDFSVCISMYHAIELLERHGMRVFLNYFNDNNPDGNAEEKFFVMKDSNIKQFINDIRSESNITPFTDEDTSFHGNLSTVDLEPIDYGHPKFEILQNCLLDHFKAQSDTKSIVFCEYRESVFLINRMLLTNRPLIKPKVFVGQGSSHNRTITQKEQIAIMNDFRSGKCNTLIATCVAEEGIDVGEVDFIVCFDVNNKNPIRFVQRIGRTGRKRQGKVTMLVTEGKEQQILREILATKDGINQKIAKSNEIKSVMYKDCPRLVPPEFNPQCIETYIEIKNTQQEPTTSTNAKTKAKKTAKPKGERPKSKTPKKTNGRKGSVRQFFKPLEIDDELEENFDLSLYRGNTSAGHNENVTNDGNSMTENLIEIIQNEAINRSPGNIPELNPHQADQMHEDQVSLKVKLEQIFSRYCDIKSQTKWHGFNERVSKKCAIDNDKVPSIVRDFLNKYKRENECRVFRTSVNPWTVPDQIEMLQIMSLLRLPERQPEIQCNISEAVDSIQQPLSKDEFEFDSQTNIMLDSQMSFSMQMDHQSKYASQIKSQPELNLPLMTCSTPQKSSNIRLNRDIPIHSPIVSIPVSKIFESALQKRRSKIDKSDPKWYLKYLGLNSVFDLFSDDEHDRPINNNNNNKSDEQQAALCDNLNKSICGNESLVEDSQYTVSRILKICEDAEKEKVERSALLANTGSTTRRKRLYIGSVNDLFCDDDDDDGDDSDVIINTQVIGTTLSESDDTVDYDVDDAIAQHQNLHNSTNLFKDTIVGEPSIKQNASNATIRSVTGTKSDELFSTYNESIANISKANASHAKNATNRNSEQQDRSIQTTPKKSHNTNFVAYHSRSPSMLFKSSSILTAKMDINQSTCNTSKTSSNHSDKSPTLLGNKLSVLNSQLSLSRHFEDIDEIKENFSSPFATCRTAAGVNPNANRAHNLDCETDMSNDDDDIFATCKQIMQSTTTKARSKTRKKRKNRGKFNFIDDEAAVSGDESSDDDFIATQAAMLNVTEQVEEDDPSVDMQAKYLQSIRSPVNRHRFRIPGVGYRNPTATQNIFSQFVAPDQSKYDEDSFVVGTDEEMESDSRSDCTEISNDQSTDLDEITIAEIRPNKRKSDDIKNGGKKRRRIIEMSSDSD